MALRQIQSSVQSDGNFSQLDCRDTDFDGLLYRIETFRCSHSDNEDGVTAAGSAAVLLCGSDHLIESSNATFRHIFSLSEARDQKVVLEIREGFDTRGGWDVRTRDLDATSPSFGSIVQVKSHPLDDGRYELTTTIYTLTPKRVVPVFSPIGSAVAELTGLPDIASNDDELERYGYTKSMALKNLSVHIGMPTDELKAKSEQIREHINSPFFAKLKSNISEYQRFGDFRDKAIHPGTNLTGDNPALMSELMTVRAYRASMIHLGWIFDEDMQPGPHREFDSGLPVTRNSKSGVYAIFLNAYISGVESYRLSLDKVHSDYSGVPLRRGAGSRMETGSVPILDADRANLALADLSLIFYLGRKGSSSIARYYGLSTK